MCACICLSAIVVVKFSTENGCLKLLVVLRCLDRFMYLILMYIDISLKMFTLIEGKGIPVLYCV